MIYLYWKLRWKLRWALSKNFLLVNVIRNLKGRENLLVTQKTQLVIEGYPRSGNSFFREAVWLANPGLGISSHLHFIANVDRALLLDKPIVVLVRPPIDAIASYLVYRGGVRTKRCIIKGDGEVASCLVNTGAMLTAGQAIKEYVEFYEFVYKHRSRIVVTSFDTATKDAGSVIDEINKVFARAFNTFASTPENIQTCLDRIPSSTAPVWATDKKFWTDTKNKSIPNSNRAPLKAEAVKVLGSKKFAKAMARADELYSALVGES